MTKLLNIKQNHCMHEMRTKVSNFGLKKKYDVDSEIVFGKSWIKRFKSFLYVEHLRCVILMVINCKQIIMRCCSYNLKLI